MFVLEEILNFHAINSGFSGLEIRDKKKHLLANSKISPFLFFN
jgi:hypothetical protein